MFRPRLIAAFALSLLLLPLGPFGPLGARANDAVAGLEAGELVMRTNGQVEMAEEELYLSRAQIRLRYVFRNHSDQPVDTLVAFPLPPIHMQQDYEYGFGPAHRNPRDPVNFRLWVDGRERAVSLKARAVTPEGVEVTGLLEKWQIPLIFLTPDAASYQRLWQRLDALPPQARAELSAAGAILERAGEPGFTANWTSYFSYYWQMRFPPGVDVEVRHTYTPVPEAFILGRYELESGMLRDEACIDADFLAAALARFGKDEYGATTGYLLRYILTTANSWRGPIGRFHLIVDKGEPGALVSLCRDGIRKTGATTFEWWAENWVPQRDLSLLFLDPRQ